MYKRKIAIVLAALSIIAITLFSFLYIIHESQHQCTGEDCPICACIHQTEKTINTLIKPTVQITIPLKTIFPTISIIPIFISFIYTFSLIQSKTRMNN